MDTAHGCLLRSSGPRPGAGRAVAGVLPVSLWAIGPSHTAVPLKHRSLLRALNGAGSGTHGRPTAERGSEEAYAATGWTLRRFAQEVNKIATERGTPTRYQPPSVHQWLDGHMPKEEVRPLILEALARHLKRPVAHAEAGFPPQAYDRHDVSTVVGLLVRGSEELDASRRCVIGAGAKLFSVVLAIPGWQDVVGRMEAIQTGRIPSSTTSRPPRTPGHAAVHRQRASLPVCARRQPEGQLTIAQFSVT